LADDWRLSGLEEIAQVVSLKDIGGPVQRILAGQVWGRVLVRVADNKWA
jgi:hypothetical protein